MANSCSRWLSTALRAQGCRDPAEPREPRKSQVSGC
jgi:hypothetical protein